MVISVDVKNRGRDGRHSMFGCEPSGEINIILISYGFIGKHLKICSAAGQRLKPGVFNQGEKQVPSFLIKTRQGEILFLFLHEFGNRPTASGYWKHTLRTGGFFEIPRKVVWEPDNSPVSNRWHYTSCRKS